MPNDSDAIAVFITTPNREEAGLLAEMLVDARLAACVQILPEMESVYRWQGKIERQKEVLIIVKTAHARFAELETLVRSHHTYDTPEIVAVTLTAGSQPYLDWLSASVGVDE